LQVAGIAGAARFEFRRRGRQYRRMAAPLSRRIAAALALVLAVPALAGCGVRLREASLSDRCGRLMQEAFPGGDVTVTTQEAVTPPTAGLAAAVVVVHGVRRNVAPGGVLQRELAVECRFDEGILIGFRWTQGPLR